MTRKPGEEMIQSAVRLPRSLHELLRDRGGERGMGEEIRRRPRASFEAETPPDDPKTRELLDAIEYLALTIALDDEWHKDPFAFAVFRAAIMHLLDSYEPAGKLVVSPE